jgi:hypothetical protein
MDLDLAFRATTFYVDANPAACLVNEMALRIEHLNREWDTYLKRRGKSTWASITAYNPNATEQCQAENEAAQQRLRNRLEELGFPYLEGRGQGGDAANPWPPEPCFFVLGIRLKEAVEVGHEFGQVAVVWGHLRERAKLVYMQPAPPPKISLTSKMHKVSDRPRDLTGFIPNLAYQSAPPEKKLACRQYNETVVQDLVEKVDLLVAEGLVAEAVASVAFRQRTRPISGAIHVNLAVYDWSFVLCVEGEYTGRRANLFDLRWLSRLITQSPAHAAEYLAEAILSTVPLPSPGEAAQIPPGLTKCKMCGEYEGWVYRFFLTDGLAAPDATHELHASCACPSYPCPRCKIGKIRARDAKRYVPDENRLVPWPKEGACKSCLTEQALRDEMKVGSAFLVFAMLTFLVLVVFLLGVWGAVA